MGSFHKNHAKGQGYRTYRTHHGHDTPPVNRIYGCSSALRSWTHPCFTYHVINSIKSIKLYSNSLISYAFRKYGLLHLTGLNRSPLPIILDVISESPTTFLRMFTAPFIYFYFFTKLQNLNETTCISAQE